MQQETKPTTSAGTRQVLQQAGRRAGGANGGDDRAGTGTSSDAGAGADAVSLGSTAGHRRYSAMIRKMAPIGAGGLTESESEPNLRRGE